MGSIIIINERVDIHGGIQNNKMRTKVSGRTLSKWTHTDNYIREIITCWVIIGWIKCRISIVL